MTKKESALIVSKKPGRGILVLAFLGLASILVVSCSPSSPAIPLKVTSIETEYIGRVVDINTQQTIADAKVSLDLEGVPPIVYTDNEGVYRFKLTVYSTITGQVKVEAKGYQTYTRNISILASDNTIADIRLTPQLLPSPAFTTDVANTFPPIPLATSTLQVKTFSEKCIFFETWKVHSLDSNILNSVFTLPNGCYDMGSMGIFVDNAGVLNILSKNKPHVVVSGIETPINNDSVIEFKVFVNSMYLPENDKSPLFATFAVASAADPLNFKNTARFKLQVDRTDDQPPIVFVLADTGENNGAAVQGQHYGYGNTYMIRLQLTGNIMNVYINNIKMHERLSVPVGPKVLYIGYNLPAQASMDVEVSDLKIDGILK